MEINGRPLSWYYINNPLAHGSLKMKVIELNEDAIDMISGIVMNIICCARVGF